MRAPFCRTDSHWSGRGCVVAAELLAKRHSRASLVRRRAQAQRSRANGAKQKITGDLAATAWSPMCRAGERSGCALSTDGSGVAPADWRESPILLLGDSHTLVFHAGDEMHGAGAGLADQLAIELGFAVDVVGVRGSGATPARINLLRRQDNMAGKKLVIWCFAAREFTEAPGGWRLVPVIIKASKGVSSHEISRRDQSLFQPCAAVLCPCDLQAAGPALMRTDSLVNFNWGDGSPGEGVPADGFSVRWTGSVRLPRDGKYTFYTVSDDGIRLWVDDQSGDRQLDRPRRRPKTRARSSCGAGGLTPSASSTTRTPARPSPNSFGQVPASRSK